MCINMFATISGLVLLLATIQQLHMVAGIRSSRGEPYYHRRHAADDVTLRGRRRELGPVGSGENNNNGGELLRTNHDNLLNYINGNTLTSRRSRFEQDFNNRKFDGKNVKKFAYQNDVVSEITFIRDFPDKFNPRSRNDKIFEFQLLEDQVLLDNAAFMRVDSSGLLDMVSVPFGRWLPQTRGLPATAAVYDATVATQQALPVGAGEVLSVKLVLNCRTINTELHRFPANVVANASSDPRLASCGLYLTDLTSGTGLEFAILLTNGAIWGTYSRQLATRAAIGANFDAFDVYRLFGLRQNKHELVEVGIEIDRRLGETRYHINKQLVWTVDNWGLFTERLQTDANNKVISYTPAVEGQQQQSAANPESFILSVINGHKMDISDPNELETTTMALVRLTDQPNYYESHVEFADEKSRRFSSLFGQGCIAGLKQLVIVRQKPLQQFASSAEESESNVAHAADLDSSQTPAPALLPQLQSSQFTSKQAAHAGDSQSDVVNDGRRDRRKPSDEAQQVAVGNRPFDNTTNEVSINVISSASAVGGIQHTVEQQQNQLQERLQKDQLREQQLEQLQKELLRQEQRVQDEQLRQRQELQRQQRLEQQNRLQQLQRRRKYDKQLSRHRDQQTSLQQDIEFLRKRHHQARRSQQPQSIEYQGDYQDQAFPSSMRPDQRQQDESPPIRPKQPLHSSSDQLPQHLPEQQPILLQQPSAESGAPTTYTPAFDKLGPLVNQQLLAFNSPKFRNDDKDYMTVKEQFSQVPQHRSQSPAPLVMDVNNYTLIVTTRPTLTRRTIADASPARKGDYYAQLYKKKLLNFFHQLDPLR